MGANRIYGTPLSNGVINNPYNSNQQTEHIGSFAPQSSFLEKTPPKDTFVNSNQPLNQTYSEKVFSNIQDRILVKLFPEKFIAKYANKEFLESAVNNNPKIAKMLKEQGLEVKIEPENVTSIIKSHLIPTMYYAKQIMNQSGQYFSANDYEAMTQAALLHDIGKALIPSEILNKKEKLTEKDRAIIELHNDLGYEILKSTSLNPKILTMVRNHHLYDKSRTRDSLAQILSVADIYSALKEQRAYKKPMSDEQAFRILDEKAQVGEFETSLVSSLKTALNINSSTHQAPKTAVA